MLLQEKQLSFHITTCCTLNCKLCAVLVPRLKKARLSMHIPLEQIKQEMDSIFQIYSFIQDVTINGGEPLSHPDLPEIIRSCMKYEKQFNSLRIFSNGTIIPSTELIQLIKQHDKLSLVLDDYGPERSKKVQQISKLFLENGLPLRISPYWGTNQHCHGWVDYGDPSQYRDYTSDRVRSIYYHCHSAQYKCLTVYNGKLGNCSWSVFGNELNIMHSSRLTEEMNAYPLQILDILNPDISLSDKQQIVSSFGKIPLLACQYCNGFDPENSIRVPAAEQEHYQEKGGSGKLWS